MSDELQSHEPTSSTEMRELAQQHGSFRAKGSGDTSGFGGLVRKQVIAGPTSRPFGSYFDDVADQLERSLKERGVSKAVEFFTVQRDQLTIKVKREQWLEVAQALRDDAALRFEVCVGVHGVHWPNDRDQELHAVYELLSMTHNRRVQIEVTCPDADSHVPSVTAIWPGTDWHEREAWDFFGIVFDGHPGLTRIQMPDDWQGHPQRKDYPLGGINVEFKGVSVPAPSLRRDYA